MARLGWDVTVVTDCIKMYGTTDNYNTKVFERLHIDLAKEGWRASNT